VTCWLR